MSILGKLGRFFFQKRGNAFGVAETERRNDMRYNALYALDPDVLVRHLAAFARGDICGLERVLEEFEAREDKMRIGAFKMAAAVASKPWEVRVAKGEEENPRAARHKEVLTRFWNRAVATDAFCRNRKGGVRLLVKQMMGAQSRVYSVHDIVWKVHGDGSLSAEFTHVPAWCFENRSGRLRYIRNDGDSRGEEMRDGEWMVTVGEGVGIAAAILAMAKRLSWNDWLLFSEKCGMPVIMGNTSAQRGSPAWKAMEKAIKAIAPKTGLLADTGTQLNAVSMGGSGKDTYRDLVDTVDRAISALYRGGDLATVSSVPSAAGVNAQQGESELMDADGCAMVSETLRDQVERFVVRFECGDEVPLAGIVINPPAETLDTEREIRIDQHLAALGVKLSKADALARYGRAEAKEEGDALKAGGDAAAPAAAVDGRPPEGGFGGFRQALHNERKGEASPLLRAFAKDTGPAAARMEALLERLDAGEDVTAEARKLAGELPGLMKGEPEMAAVLEEEMAKAFAEGLGGGAGDDEATKGRGDEGGEGNGETHAEAQRGGGAEGKPVAMANENPYHCPKCGKFAGFNGHCDKCDYTLDAGESMKRAERLLGKAQDGTMLKPIDGLAYRDEIGQIDLEVGKRGEGRSMLHGTGFAKLEQKHLEDLHSLPETLAKGEIMPTTKGARVGGPYDPDRRAIVHGDYVAFLERKDKRCWKIATHYKDADEASRAEEVKRWLRSEDRSQLRGAAE